MGEEKWTLSIASFYTPCLVNHDQVSFLDVVKFRFSFEDFISTLGVEQPNVSHFSGKWCSSP
jgi:hypothetical protein